MALEEPELHIPPPLQRRVVQRLQSLAAQTFISSHSPTVAGMSDPRALQVLRNVGGMLTSTPLSTATSLAEDSNPVRNLFELHRQHTLAALMHDAILIPEGRTDGELLELLAAAVDAKQSWLTTDESRFAAHVGLIRTQDGAVVGTFRRLRTLHPNAVPLVDGDGPGKKYLAALAVEPVPPTRALRWPDDWTIEDVVGWVISADPAALAAITDTEPPPHTVPNLVERLKSSNRDAGGLKQNRLAYEAVAEAVAATPAALRRARELLNALTDEVLGESSLLFVDDVLVNGKILVRVFKA
jgi:putative ATP-dependent endonuclease of OLD family